MVADPTLEPENDQEERSDVGIVSVVYVDHPHWKDGLVVAVLPFCSVAEDPVVEALLVFIQITKRTST